MQKTIERIKPISKAARVLKAADIDKYFHLRVKQAEYLRYYIIEKDRIDLLAELAGLRYDPIHEALIEHQRDNLYSLQLAFRGCGKTTVGTILKTAHKILKNRNHRHLIASESAGLAWEILSSIKSILTCDSVTEVFGDLKGDVWHESAINIAGRTTHAKEKTVNTCGADGAITGGHFDEIDVDDLVTFRNSRTHNNRQKIKDWFKMTLLPMVTDENTGFHIKGTPYHPDDLYSNLRLDDTFKKNCQIIPAFVPGTHDSNYPERFNKRFFLRHKRLMGEPMFRSQFEMDASGIQGDMFDADHFRYYSDLPIGLRIYAGVDLAVGKKAQNDMFAIVVIGVDPKTLDIYILDYRRAKLSLIGQNNLILAKTVTWNPIRIGIESNAFQAAKLQELKNHRKFKCIPALPIFSTEDKITEAQRVQARYERGEVWHAKRDKDGVLEGDLLAFPDGQYKDLVDALSIAIRTAFRKKRRKEKRRKNKIPIIGGRNGINSRFANEKR